MHQIRQNARPTIRERREKREERAQIRERERDDRASPRWRAVRSTSTLVERALLVDRWAARSSNERRVRSSIAALDRRSRSCTAVRSSDERRDRRSCRSSAWRGAIVPLSLWSGLSLLSSLSLSLSFSGSELKWKWGEKFISGSKVKFVVNRKSFSGK